MTQNRLSEGLILQGCLIKQSKKVESKSASGWCLGPRAPWRQEEFLPSALWSDLLVSDLTKQCSSLGGRTVKPGHPACALQRSVLYVGLLKTHEGPSTQIWKAALHTMANRKACLRPLSNKTEK